MLGRFGRPAHMSTTNAHASLCGQKLLRDILYQLKLIKMRAELANLNDCVVPFLSRAAVNLC